MVEAALFWVLAVYGAATVVYQCVLHVQRRAHNLRSITFVLVVQNADAYIEGVIRSFMMKTAAGRRSRAIVIIDVASQDDTPQILQALVHTHRCLRFAQVVTEAELQNALQAACLGNDSIGCVYDLRVETGGTDTIHDVLWSC